MNSESAPPTTPPTNTAWLFRSQEELATAYMANHGLSGELARRLIPAMACAFCNGKGRARVATAWLPLPPDFPDPAAPACGFCWSQGLYVMLHQETSIYRL